MDELLCLNKLTRLKEMLSNGEKGNATYFSSRLNVSTRTFFRMKNHLCKIYGIRLKFNKLQDAYYLE